MRPARSALYRALPDGRPNAGRGTLLLLLGVAGIALCIAGLFVGSTGWAWPDPAADRELAWQIMRDIRAPRSIGAWAAGALLGLAGAVAQGLFRNALADPYLLGSSSGAALGVAIALAAGAAVAAGTAPIAWSALGLWTRLGLTGAGFIGALAAVLLSLALSRGAQHTGRLLLAGIVVSVVLGAFTSVIMLLSPDILRAMQAFMLGTTGFLGWSACWVLIGALTATAAVSCALARGLDAMILGEETVSSLGVRLDWLRAALVGALALATAAAVAQAGLVAFVGLAAPHLVRRLYRRVGPHAASPAFRELAIGAALAGGALLLGADVIARALIAPQELPVGVVTAVLGGSYLLWLLRGRAR